MNIALCKMAFPMNQKTIPSPAIVYVKLPEESNYSRNKYEHIQYHVQKLQIRENVHMCTFYKTYFQVAFFRDKYYWNVNYIGKRAKL
jgi:hypothetical protein